MKMTKEQFANFRTEIESALSDIATKYGCIVEAGNIKYDDICTTVSVAFKTETAEVKAEDKPAKAKKPSTRKPRAKKEAPAEDKPADTVSEAKGE